MNLIKAVCAVLALLLLLCACSRQASNAPSQVVIAATVGQTSTASADKTASSVLHVGIYRDETQSIQAILADFAEQNPDISLQTETYNSKDELLVKVIAGDVPDIFWFGEEYSTLQSLAGNGLLQDLSGFAQTLDEDGEYYRNILTTGTLSGGVYLLFPAFTVEVFSAPTTILPESCKIESIQQFNDLFQPYCTQGYGWTTRDIVLNWFLHDGFTRFIDYDAKKANFQTQNFYDILEFCKQFPSEFEEATASQAFRTITLRSPVGILSEVEHYERFSSFAPGVSLSPLPFSSYSGYGVNADSVLAMTTTCQNPLGATALLQFVFCADTQKTIAQQENGKLIVHKQTLETLWAQSEASPEWREACDEMQSILQQVDHLNSWADDSAMEIINEEVAAFFHEDATAQDVAVRIEQRMNLYLMEQGY